MGTYEARGQITKGMKMLLLQWAETKTAWDDAQSKQFEEKYLSPLEYDLRNAVGAMDHMSILLGQIHRDCE